VRVPKEKHRRNAGRKDRKPLGAVLGAPWPEEHVRVLQSITKLDLTPETSDSELLRAHETESLIVIRALEVFGDSDRAIQWLGESNPALNNEPPIRVIQTDDGRREVLDILGRIQHGVIS
jgi:putative toxin-antitoxin system antitoxin component (TIGR02293 family)